MIVVHNGQKVFVGWRYDNPELDKLLSEHGITQERARKMNEVEILSAVGGKTLPKPLTTHCIFTDEDKKEITSASVTRFYKDPYDKDKARRYSLGKVLNILYPGDIQKETRAKFWEAYIRRGSTQPVTVV